jgi:hypothetical protein
MRKIYILLLAVLVAPLFTHAQELVLTPQIGIQGSNTKIGYNNSPYYTPCRDLTGLAGFRLNYQSKKGHGPYIGFGLATSTTTYMISDPGSTFGSFGGSVTDVFRIQAGYQWNTKPIYFKRLWDNNISREEFARLKKKGWSMRFQPYVGIGIDLRNGNATNYTTQSAGTTITTYYGRRSLNINTGVNFEFSKNDKKLFTLGFSLVHGLGNMQTTIINKNYNGVDYHTQLFNRSSGFNITLGVPLTLWMKSKAKKRRK